MKTLIALFVMGASLLMGGTADIGKNGNDYYNRLPVMELETAELVVDGEVAKPGPVDLKAFPLHVVTIRHAHLHHKGREFMGAYRIEGVSLFDILKMRRVRKKANEFPPPVDLFLEISDAAGHVVMVSWGEVFFARTPHRILVATRISPIVPTKVKSAMPMPDSSMLVCADDLYGVRNLPMPNRITVRAAKVNVPINRKLDYVASRRIKISMGDIVVTELTEGFRLPGRRSMRSVFYGRGRGFHGFHDFTGWDLASVLDRYINTDPEFLARGYLVATSVDGYRSLYSASEVFNRNDGNVFLLLDGGLCENKGPWALFPGPDFFSDRAVAGVNEIRVTRLHSR